MIGLFASFALIALFFAVMVAGAANVLAWGLVRILPSQNPRALAHVSAAFLPLIISIWLFAEIYLAQQDDTLNGPAVQGLAGMFIIALVLVGVAWPLGFHFARKTLGAQ